MKRGVAVVVLLAACTHEPGTSTPLVPAGGYDDYLHWERWPLLQINTRTVMRSTFDRAGGNDASDASHFLAQNERGLVAASVIGNGTLTFARANHWHGSPWRYTVDGQTTEVTESTTADPDHPQMNSVWAPAIAFPPDLTETWSTTRGADLSWVRVPFTKSLEIAYGRSHYGTGYFILQLAPQDLAAPPSTWAGNVAPPASVLDLFRSAGSDIAPTDIASMSGNGAVIDLPGPGTLRALKIDVPLAQAEAFAHSHMRIRWDGRPDFSVDTPVGLFFGAASLHNRDKKEWLVKAFPVNVHFGDSVELAVYFPMPFSSNAHIEFDSPVGWSARWEATAPETPNGYFHATYRDHANPVPGHDLVMLDTNGLESAPAWCGKIVGNSWVFSDRAVFGTLEGDPRFFFDDSQTPQVQGTGTEEWGGGGDYWGGQTMTLPFLGHPVGAPSIAQADGAEDAIEGAYRFLLGDAMPFGRRALLQLEHGGADDSTEHYQSLVYWYGSPSPCLTLTDSLHVGDLGDEAAHGYVATGASDPYSVTSRYELGVDHVGSEEIFPAMTDSGRVVTGSTEFTTALPADNAGVMLRRTLDYAIPDQTAEIWVRDASVLDAPFEHAATWGTPGSTQELYANSPTESGVAPPFVRVIDRRWKDDELLLAPRFSAGKSALRVRVVPASGTKWTEFHYAAYAWSRP